jgi:glucose/arabinose dehydrogenase
VIVKNLPSGGHGAKGIAVKGDMVYYSLGSSGNRTPADRTAMPKRATIWRVGLTGTGNTAIAKGVRNGFGLAIGPGGWVFTAVNQMDDQPYPFKDSSGQYGNRVQSYINENPVDQVTRITMGIDLGWPYCVPDTRKTPTLLKVPFVNDPEFNPTGGKINCAKLPKTMLGLPGHSAPLGLNFTTGTKLAPVIGTGALITTHGSWDRTPPRAPVVLFSPWNSSTKSLGATVPLVGGFQNSDGSRWGRCVDAVVGPDGSLYVTDDAAGLVYRITPG